MGKHVFVDKLISKPIIYKGSHLLLTTDPPPPPC